MTLSTFSPDLIAAAAVLQLALDREFSDMVATFVKHQGGGVSLGIRDTRCNKRITLAPDSENISAAPTLLIPWAREWRRGRT